MARRITRPPLRIVQHTPDADLHADDTLPATDTKKTLVNNSVPKGKAEQARKAKRRRMALDLRAAGLTEDQITEQMVRVGENVTLGRVRGLIDEALTEYAQRDQRDVEMIRQLELTRINEALRVLWPKVREGNLKAMREYRAFIDQRARLLGLYAAQKHEVQGSISHVLSQQDHSEIARLEEAFLNASAEEIVDVDVLELPPPDVS